MSRKHSYELGLLLLQLLGLGFLVVPRHTNTYWDPEFTAWVVPLANRFSSGQTLYTAGAHSPLPPLSYVLTYFLTAGHGIWWHESLMNYICQCLTLVVMFLVISQLSDRLVAFVACSASLPLFLALAKSILYDSLAQLLVACTILAAVKLVSAPDRKFARTCGLGILIGLLLLTKQSTAIGAFAGSILVLLLLRLVRDFGALLGGATLAVVLGLLAMSPWVDAHGFVHDTIVTGSEPKGGPRAVAFRLGFYSLELLGHGAIVLVLGMALLCWFGVRETFKQPPATDTGMRAGLLAWPVVLSVSLCALLTHWQYSLPPITAFFMWPALIFYLFTTGRGGSPSEKTCAVLAFSCAVGHCLSVNEFRFFYDNNPLLVLVVANLITQFFKAPPGWFAWRWWGVPVAPVTPIVIILIGAWLHAAPRLYGLGQAAMTVPDIPYLAGAKLPPRAEDGLLDLVREVRHQTAATDRVLLLPEDPNLESWIERPRPALTSAVLFMDTYWDHFVPEDLRRLEADPPKVVIIGPKEALPSFDRYVKLKGSNKEGVTRLIEELKPLLSRRYQAPRDFEVQGLARPLTSTPDTVSSRETFSVYYLKK